MKIILDDSDFPELESQKQSDVREVSGAAADSGTLEEKVHDLLPEKLAKRVRDAWGDLQGYELEGFDVTVSVEGAPFGVGISGQMVLQYRKKQ